MHESAPLAYQDRDGNVAVVLDASPRASPSRNSAVGWGFVPSTLGDDGGRIDVLVLQPDPTRLGAVQPSVAVAALQVRLLERDQHDPHRNERLIMVAARPTKGTAREQLSAATRRELESFVVAAAEADGKRALIEAWEDAAYAVDALARANAAYRRANV